MKLSWIETKQYIGWRKYIGRSESGFAHPFYLGRDRGEAEQKARKLQAAWKAIQKAQGTFWTAEAIDAALEAPEGPATAQKPTGAMLLSEGLTAYGIHCQARANSGQVSRSWQVGMHTRLNRAKRLIPDQKIKDVDAQAIMKMVARITSRPTSKDTGRSLSVDSVCDTLKALKSALDWLDLTEQWQAPRRFERLFRIRRRALMKPTERAMKRTLPTFTLDELKAFYARVPERVKLFVLLGLNCGFTQSDISGLLKADIDLDLGVITRHRPKTGVASRHELWAETLELVKKNLAPRGSDLAFLSHHGQPLVRYRGNSRCDGIQRWWQRMKAPKAFKCLRKTGASYVRERCGLEAAKLYLSHAEDTMAGRHYANRSGTLLDEPLRELRGYLEPMFQAANKRARLAA